MRVNSTARRRAVVNVGCGEGLVERPLRRCRPRPRQGGVVLSSSRAREVFNAADRALAVAAGAGSAPSSPREKKEEPPCRDRCIT